MGGLVIGHGRRKETREEGQRRDHVIVKERDWWQRRMLKGARAVKQGLIGLRIVTFYNSICEMDNFPGNLCTRGGFLENKNVSVSK